MIDYNIPLFQGDLDGMCGIYSIVNAYRFSNVDEDKSQELFDEIVRYFARKRMLEEIILGGTNFKEINMVMRDVCYKYLNYSISWAGFPSPTTKQFWKSMQKHLTKQGNCIILGVSGKEDHWSVVVKSTPRGMKLSDSSGWIYLRQKLCTTKFFDLSKYVLYPAQTFFIYS